MKKKLKTIIFIIFLALIVILFLYLKFKSYNYNTKYVINDFKIEESYNKEDNTYTFMINYNNIAYPYKFYSEYIRKKELINDINIYKNELETCIIPLSNNLSFYPICSNGEDTFTYNNSELKIKDYNYEKVNSDILNHDKLTINYLNNNKYLIYNYKGFYYINSGVVTEINLFNNDVYKIDLIYEFDKYIIVPDYNQSYYFNKIYIINIDNGKVKELELEYDISFNSEFLGYYKNNVYILDKKEKQEYKIDIKKLKIIKSDFLILKDNKLEKVTYKSIVNNNLKFDNNEESNYQVIDNKLYQIIGDTKLLISSLKVTKIIKELDNTIYYLVNDNLYMYNNTYGEILLITNFEWNFNNTKVIYLNK